MSIPDPTPDGTPGASTNTGALYRGACVSAQTAGHAAGRSERLRHSADNAQKTLAETRTALENVQEQVQQARHAAQQEQARHAEAAQELTAVRSQLEGQGAQAAQDLERVQTQYTQAMQQRDALQVQLSHLANAVQQHEQTLVSQREARSGRPLQRRRHSNNYTRRLTRKPSAALRYTGAATTREPGTRDGNRTKRGDAAARPGSPDAARQE